VNDVGWFVLVEDFFGRFGVRQITILGGQENPLLKTTFPFGITTYYYHLTDIKTI
jgi:hypothetical protein